MIQGHGRHPPSGEAVAAAEWTRIELYQRRNTLAINKQAQCRRIAAATKPNCVRSNARRYQAAVNLCYHLGESQRQGSGPLLPHSNYHWVTHISMIINNSKHKNTSDCILQGSTGVLWTKTMFNGMVMLGFAINNAGGAMPR